MHGDIALNGWEFMVGKSTLGLVSDWVGSIKWENVQQSRTIVEMVKKICVRYQQVRIDFP